MNPLSANPDNIPPSYWQAAPELDNTPDSSRRGPFQESYFERLVRARDSQYKDRTHLPQQSSSYTQPSISPNMSATTVNFPTQSSHPWGSVWNTERKSPTPVSDLPVPTSSGSSGITSGRFNQLLQAKLAAEQRTPSDVAGASSSLNIPPGLNNAFSQLQASDTVVNRSFASQYYVQPVEEDIKPIIPTSSDRQSGQAGYYGYPVPKASSFPQPVEHSQASSIQAYPPYASEAVTGGRLPSATFRAINDERSNNLYAGPQAQYNGNQPPYIAQEQSQPYWQGTPSYVPPVAPQNPGMLLQPFTPDIQQSGHGGVPSSPATHSPVDPSSRLGANWSQSRSEQAYLQGQSPAARASSASYQQPPFLWNVTSPQSSHMQLNAGSHTPSLHTTSDSTDSSSIGPITPLLSPYRQYAVPVDIKPIISPTMSVVTLPEENMPYGGYAVNPYIHASPQMGHQPRFIGASTEGQSNGNAGNGDIYGSSGSQGGDNGLGGGGGFDPSGTLNGLGFGSNGGGSGSGGDEQKPHDDGMGSGSGGGGESSSTPKGKKLPLACHFCRRRKLKCDGRKPSCENCDKRSVECTYDDNVRRRGPGKRTKEMRDRAAREAEAAGLVNNNSVSLGHTEQPNIQLHDDPHSDFPHDLPIHPDLSAHDFQLDPSLAGEDGNNPEDVMDAMSALKEAGMDLGLHDTDLEGEPNTLAEVSGLGEAIKDENERKRKSTETAMSLEEAIKRQRLELQGAQSGIMNGQENEISPNHEA